MIRACRTFVYHDRLPQNYTDQTIVDSHALGSYRDDRYAVPFTIADSLGGMEGCEDSSPHCLLADHGTSRLTPMISAAVRWLSYMEWIEPLLAVYPLWQTLDLAFLLRIICHRLKLHATGGQEWLAVEPMSLTVCVCVTRHVPVQLITSIRAITNRLSHRS